MIVVENGPSVSGGAKTSVAAMSQVNGVVTTSSGVALPDLRVELWDVNLGGETLLATGVTDARGGYLIYYDPLQLAGKPRADLSVRAVDPGKQNAEVARSATLFQADPKVTVNLAVAAAQTTRPSEYTRLLAAVQPLLGTTPLAALDAKGVEYVANRSRWDARNVAMAAQAARLVRSTDIPTEHYYALMRTGLPGDADVLHRLPTASIARALELAIASGVIAADHPIDATLKLQQRQSAAALQQFAPASAMSSMSAMLALSLDAAHTATFLDAYHATGDRPEELWNTLAQRGFDAATIARLQTDGKLGFLTHQNAPLIGRLRSATKIAAVEDLPGAGLYKAEVWKPLIGSDAPPQLGVDAYARQLAAHVNLSYPTLVVAEMVRNGELVVNAAPGPAPSTPGAIATKLPPKGNAEVAAFLSAGHGKYTIGVDPVNQWAGYDKLTAQARDGLRLTERLYQLSPSNDSMIALGQLGLHSAFQITQQPRDEFLSKHGGAFPSQAEAELVYQKAQEISTTTLNIATAYLTQRSAPNVYAMTGDIVKQLPPPGPPGLNDPPVTPTLEKLFQNMDYCACDECKSVLGAAAYFVDLLQFIDVKPDPSQDPNQDPTKNQNPLDVLLGRRPDLGSLLLSCENTNIALPYVDLVSEILEYYILHGSLTGFTGYNMREDSTTADLLADPEYVKDAAYDKTKAEVFPHSLPFDMPLAALRLLMKGWGTTFADALRMFGTPAAARQEVLGLDATEASILTDAKFRTLPEYFGEPAALTIDALNDAIANGKTFSRRTEITYEDLVALLRTRFINPGAPLVPLLMPLQISLAQLQSWYTGAIDDAALKALLPGGLVAADYGGDVLQWLRDHQALIMGLITLTDVGPDAQECNFATVELRFALPDNAANRLTELAYHKLLRFIRLWKRLGWSIELTDQVVTTFLGSAPEALTSANLDATFTALLARIASFVALQRRQSIASAKIADWLPIWNTSRTPTIRRDQLALLLRIGTTDLAQFSGLTGIDPLADDMASDSPSLLRFLDAWAALKATPLKVTDLNYLLRHHDDSGTLMPTEDSLRRDLKALRDGLTAVNADLAAPPANADLGYTRSKMALVYDAATVDRFIGLIAGSTTYRAPLATIEEALPAKLVEADARLGFDPFRKALTHTGILSASAALQLGDVASNLELGDVAVIKTQPELDAFVASFKVAVQGLLAAGSSDLAALDTDLKGIYDAVAPITDPAAQAVAVVDLVLPTLRGRLHRLAMGTALTTLLKIDAALVDALLAGKVVVPAVGDPTTGVVEDFLHLDDAVVLSADGTFGLYLDPPATDDYTLSVGAPAGTNVMLAIDGVPVLSATVGSSGEVATPQPLALRAGVLVSATLTLATLSGGAAELRWRTKGMAKAAVPASRLYAGARFAHARASLLRLQKAALLLRAIPLTPRELQHLATYNPDTAGILSAIGVDGSISDAALHAQWTRVMWLSWFSQLKADEPDADTWVDLLEVPGRVMQGKLVLAAVAGWTEQDLADVLEHFGLTLAGPWALHVLRRGKDAVDFVVATGQTAADLLAWSVAVPDAALIAAIKASLRAHQPPAAWRATLQDVNDALRNQRRDALVSYILYHHPPAPGIDTADKLYEYFLIDVEMDACMQTSRIRQALSTVQLFVTRCMMNLEPAVLPSSIRADQWAWMKRYRVWQANREIFLYPENWLEPELRDNKSPLFAELEAELLKSDITSDLAETAYLHYLKKLDEIARLEIAGCFLEERPALHAGEVADDVLHVFGRTNGNTRQYYYRRFQGGSWTPWDKVALHIEGDIIFPVVWKSQLFLFWLSVLPKPQGASAETKPRDMADQAWSANAKQNFEITLAWGEYYQGKWTSPKSSELSRPIVMTGLDPDSFDPRKLFVAARTDKSDPNISERLMFCIKYFGKDGEPWFTALFHSKNAPPDLHKGLDSQFFDVFYHNHVLLASSQPAGQLDTDAFGKSGKVFNVTIRQQSTSALTETILTKTAPLVDGFRVRPLMHPIANQWEAPIFYTDEHSTFFITADERIDLIAHYTGYFYNDTSWLSVPPDTLWIPPLYEKPVIDDPLGPVESPLVLINANSNYERVISTNHQFTYSGVTFDAGGVVGDVLTKEAGR